MTLPGIFVVGTDTGVGKTRVAAAIARCLIHAGRRVAVLKLVATGAVREGESWRSDDADHMIEAIGGGVGRERVCPLVFEEPLAPVVAARLSGATLQFEEIERAVGRCLTWWAGRAEVMVAEGVGGLLTPLAERTTVADLALLLDYPLVIVARRGLGTLNHTLLTVEAAQRRGLRLAGVVLNGAEPTSAPLAEATNRDELARRLDGVSILAELAHRADPGTLSHALRSIDWARWARPPRRQTLLDGSPPTHTGAVNREAPGPPRAPL
jgi:dethiobiotin synthetase